MCIASLIFILTCPGNAIRFSSEVKTWFPEYTTLSFFDKIQLGILTIFTYYFSCRGIIVLFPLFVMLSVRFYKISRKKFAIQIFLDFYLLLSLGLRILKKDFLLANKQLSQFSTYSKIAVFIECGILMAIAALFLYQVIFAMKNKWQNFLNALLLSAGFCSAFIIAFSPTVYASGARCYLFFSYIIFLVTFRIFCDTK